jgi:hypothetical protein
MDLKLGKLVIKIFLQLNKLLKLIKTIDEFMFISKNLKI